MSQANKKIKLLDCVTEHWFIYEFNFTSWLNRTLFLFSWFDAQLLLPCTYGLYSAYCPWNLDFGRGTKNKSWLGLFWLIWHTCQWAYAIMICPSCVIVIHCWCHHHCCHCCWCHHLCTAVPVTVLLIETSNLTDTCTYIPSIWIWNIESMWHIYTFEIAAILAKFLMWLPCLDC